MSGVRWFTILLLMLSIAAGTAAPSEAHVYVQCPGDTDGDAVIDTPDPAHPKAVCMHLTAGDGFVTMADGKLQYMFGFSNITGTPEADAMNAGMLAATLAAPTISLDEGAEFYLSLTNVGMVMRPDLFDAHSVHWHGFPQAAPVFDGVPDSSIVINMGGTFPYYYNVVEPGTFMYHCHVEAAEHMQMGMLGNLYVRPAQNQSYPGRYFVYNDGDFSTEYDVEYPIQIHSFDPEFHDASMNIQPLPFALMKDKYAMFNGRGYPDTVNTAEMGAIPENGNVNSQPMHSLITVTQGDRLLLRMSNLSVTEYFTVAALGMTMRVVGTGAHILRGQGDDPATSEVEGKDLYYETNSVTLGGGDTADVIIDTANVPRGTYFLYTTNLNYLSNNTEDYGGLMTEIVIQ